MLRHDTACRCRVCRVLDGITSSDRATWLGTFALTAYVYLLTGQWSGAEVNDAQAAYWPASWFVRHGSFFLEHVPNLPNIPWFHHVGDHVVSNRMPGVILAAVPGEFVARIVGMSPRSASVATAVLLSAAAVANVAVVLRRLSPGRPALYAALTLGLGTAMWTAASQQLWAHGPDAFWLSLALLALATRREVLAAAAMLPATVTRPHLAVAAVVVGITLAATRRSWRPLLSWGLAAGTGLAALAAWNAYFFAGPSVQGEYGHSTATVTSTSSTQLWAFLVNAAGTAVSPMRGIFLYTPVLLLAVVAVIRARPAAPDWTKAALAGGLAYEVVQLRINGFRGGFGFYSNRLALEMLVLATPYLFLATTAWMRGERRREIAVGALAAVSVAIHIVGAFGVPIPPLLGPLPSAWSTWYPIDCLRLNGWLPVVAATAFVAVVFVPLQAATRRRVARTP